jgi:uncharacterized membrane protein
MPTLTVEPIFGSFWFVALLVLALLAGLMLIPESKELSRGRHRVLWGIRILVIIAMLLALLRPGITLTTRSAPRGAIAVMVDLSSSMELASEQAKRTRWEVEQLVLKELLDNQDRLGKDSPIVVYGYDEELRALSSPENKGTLPPKPAGSSTDIGKPLSQLIATQVDPPLAAVVWLGDGTQTVTPPDIDAQQVVRQLSQLDVPLMAIGIGPRAESERLLDLAIESVPEQFEAFSRNQLVVRGILHSRGVVHRELKVDLQMRATDGKVTTLATDTLRPDKLDQSIPFRLPMVAPDEGSYELFVRVGLLDGELIAENNESQSFLNVRQGGSRILFLEGEIRPEQKFIRRSLADSQEFQIEFALMPKNRQEFWPEDRSAALASNTYSAFILGDVDADALGQENLRLLAERVKNGAGLIVLGGYNAYGPGGYANTPLADILPVMIDSRIRQGIGQPHIEELHWPGPIPFTPRGVHPVTQLGTDADNESVWTSLKPFTGANRWSKVQDLPSVKILGVGHDGQPLLVAGEAGKGRVLCAAFDSSYQWWLQGKSELHRQFWRQAILWGMRREASEETIRVEMTKRQRLFKDQTAEVLVHWTPGEKGTPIPDSTKLRVFQGGRDIGGITLTKKDDKTMQGKLESPAKSGRYELKAMTKSSEGKDLVNVLPFVVLEKSIESLYPIPDWQLMTQLGQINEPAGGGLYAPEQVKDIVEKLLERKKQAAVELVESYRVGDGEPDSWAVFIIIVGLLIIQWSLRKRWSLA